ncbi:MAG: hypothetical protein HKN67_02995 [Saprospiraceae bacterium]|nr:hypothetical protein [Saprospiraceae bacterium]
MKFSEIIGLFKEGKSTSKSHMKNLLEIAMADSHYDDEEHKLLLKLASKHGVSERELKKIQDNPDAVEFELPESEDEKFEQFYELIHMMTIDQKILDEEMSLCRVFAKKFGYSKPRDLVEAISLNIQNDQPCDETQKRVITLL